MSSSLPAKYQNVEPLDPGKNAKVWKATNANLNRDVFLKAYPIPPNDPESALHEPRLLQELAHESLVKIFDADQIEDGAELLLEMELVNGGSLQSLINTCNHTGAWLSVHEAMDRVREAANGVDHMHMQGIVHRDLKPANIMIRAMGNRKQAVVTDLGLASKLNQRGRAVASQHALLYRPPEVWKGLGYSRASDVYQLGVILFQMLGGEINYSLGQLSEVETGEAICTNRLLLWSGFGAHVGPTLRSIIEKCVGPESQRYQELTHLSVALHNCKKRQANWQRTEDKGGFVLEQRVQGGIDRIDVRRGSGNICTATRTRRVNTPAFRKEGKPLTINHPNLAHCRDFQKLLAKRKA